MSFSEENTVFERLDRYATNKHQCFVAEFFLDSAKTKYYACFRPAGGSKEHPRPQAYRYLDVSFAQVAEAVESGALPSSLSELLDKELPRLGAVTES